MPDIFLSYSRDDQAIARRFAEGFERAGFSVWWDQTLNAGEDYDKVTEKALEEAGAVAVLWSRTSVDSRWVRAEATQAERSGTLVPVMIEACKRPIMFELKQTADLSGWSGDPGDKTWQAYLASVGRLVQKGQPTKAAVMAPPQGRPRRRMGLGIAIAAVALLTIGAGLWALSRKGSGPAVPQAATPVANTEVSLAVLPFVNLSSDPEQEYFSDGLSEEILNQLAQVKNLTVTARTSSFSFKGKNEDMRVIGEKLGVDNLLEGSVRKDGKNLRITAQLIKSQSGAHLWSKSYDRELSGVFALQEEIAKDVAQALSIKLDVGNLPRAQGGTNSVEAYDKYLQAQAILRGDRYSDRIIQADQLLREAVTLDPAFVAALQGLAFALRATMVWKPESTEALRVEADNAEARVVALAPDGTFAQNVRLGQYTRERRWSEAANAAKAVTFVDVEGGNALDGISGFLAEVGRVNDALGYLERRRQRDPLNLSLSIGVQMLLENSGRPGEADAEFERSKDLVGDHGRSEHFALLRLMNHKDADREMIRARLRATLKRAPLAMDPSLVDKFADREAARAIVRKAFEDPANQDPTRLNIIARYASVFGDRDLTLAALRRGMVDLRGTTFNVWIQYEPGLRTDPRFKDIVRDVGLVDYWRSSGNWADFCKPVGTDDFECH